MLSYLSQHPKQVSCHWVIGPNGETGRIGTEDYILWHAGLWDMIKWYLNNINAHSIWLEVVSDGKNFTRAACDSTREWVIHLMKKYNIPKENVIRHRDYSTRKWDIGDNFFKVSGYGSFETWKDSLIWENADILNQKLKESEWLVKQYKRENWILRRRSSEATDALNPNWVT